MKNERYPKCGPTLQKQTDYKSIDDAFGSILEKQANQQAILKKAASLTEKALFEADEYYREELSKDDASFLAKPYLDFLLGVWEKGKNQKERNLLFTGFRFIMERSFGDILTQDPSYKTTVDAISEATDVFWATDCAESVLKKHASEMGPYFPLATVIGWIKKEGRLADDASVSFAAVATLSNMYEEIERHDVAPALKTFTEDFGLLRLFRLASNPYAEPFAKPFLDFYMKKAERIRGCRRDASSTKKYSDYKAAAEKEEEDYKKLIDLEKKSAAELSTPVYLDANGVDELHAALNALQKKKTFQLRSITFEVLQRDEHRAEVAFLFPYRVPYDVDAKSPLDRFRKRNSIEAFFVRFITSLKRGYLFKSKAEKAKAKAFYADSDWGGPEETWSNKMLRQGSCKTYDKSSIREIINGGIWNQLPPGMEDVFTCNANGDRFVLIKKGEKGYGGIMYNKPAWSGTVSPYKGAAGAHCQYDRDLEALKYAYAWVKATIDIGKFKEWIEETEEALTETLAAAS